MAGLWTTCFFLRYLQSSIFIPSSVCIHPWSLDRVRRDFRCRAIPPIIPGTPATVSSIIIRLHTKRKHHVSCLQSNISFWGSGLNFAINSPHIILPFVVWIKWGHALCLTTCCHFYFPNKNNITNNSWQQDTWCALHLTQTCRADFLKAVYFRRSLMCSLGLTNDLIDGGQPRVACVAWLSGEGEGRGDWSEHEGGDPSPPLPFPWEPSYAG